MQHKLLGECSTLCGVSLSEIADVDIWVNMLAGFEHDYSILRVQCIRHVLYVAFVFIIAVQF